MPLHRMDNERDNGSETYSLAVGMVYCFNLIMGAGLLALPKAFAQEGWFLGLGGIGVLAFMSYATVTFIIEVQSIHSALQRHGTLQREMNEIEMHSVGGSNNTSGNDQKIDPDINKDNSRENERDENSSAPVYDITMRTELGELCTVFLSRFSSTLFYVAFCMYLFGGTSIYAAAVSKSLASIVCKDHESFNVGNDSAPCQTFPQLTLMQSYRISLGIFAILCCPFVFFTLSKTKLLQLSTMAFRCFALTSMIVLALIRIIKGEGSTKPNLKDFSKLPNFISISIFAFMCQDCVTALVAPIRNKKNIQIAIFGTFCLVVLFCTSVLMTASYAFDADEIHDLYTLTFTHPEALVYILELFPVLTLGANFPMVSIVLRDNIKKLCLKKNEEEYDLFVRRIFFPLIAITPAIVISYCTYDVGMLVGYTGEYAGGIIQYVIPVILVYNARKKAQDTFGDYNNRYASRVSGLFWLVLVMMWYFLSLGLVTYSKLKNVYH